VLLAPHLTPFACDSKPNSPLSSSGVSRTIRTHFLRMEQAHQQVRQQAQNWRQNLLDHRV